MLNEEQVSSVCSIADHVTEEELRNQQELDPSRWVQIQGFKKRPGPPRARTHLPGVAQRQGLSKDFL